MPKKKKKSKKIKILKLKKSKSKASSKITEKKTNIASSDEKPEIEI